MFAGTGVFSNKKPFEAPTIQPQRTRKESIGLKRGRLMLRDNAKDRLCSCVVETLSGITESPSTR